MQAIQEERWIVYAWNLKECVFVNAVDKTVYYVVQDIIT